MRASASHNAIGARKLLKNKEFCLGMPCLVSEQASHRCSSKLQGGGTFPTAFGYLFGGVQHCGHAARTNARPVRVAGLIVRVFMLGSQLKPVGI
jgi:hypothetical protein